MIGRSIAMVTLVGALVGGCQATVVPSPATAIPAPSSMASTPSTQASTSPSPSSTEVASTPTPTSTEAASPAPLPNPGGTCSASQFVLGTSSYDYGYGLLRSEYVTQPLRNTGGAACCGCQR